MFTKARWDKSFIFNSIDLYREWLHQASIYGVVRHASLTFLAMKCRCSKQTVIDHIKILIERRILRKRVVWIKNHFCAINVYSFIISWDRTTAQRCNSQNSGQKLPRPEEREKFGSLREAIAGLHKGLRLLTPGSEPYEASHDKLVALTALLAHEHEEHGR